MCSHQVKKVYNRRLLHHWQHQLDSREYFSIEDPEYTDRDPGSDTQSDRSQGIFKKKKTL